MAEILIKGLSLPKDGSEMVVQITKHGQVARLYRNPSGNNSSFLIVRGARAIELPKHGRLVDADAFIGEYKDWVGGSMNDMICDLNFAPIIVEANDGTDS